LDDDPVTYIYVHADESLRLPPITCAADAVRAKSPAGQRNQPLLGWDLGARGGHWIGLGRSTRRRSLPVAGAAGSLIPYVTIRSRRG